MSKIAEMVKGLEDTRGKIPQSINVDQYFFGLTLHQNNLKALDILVDAILELTEAVKDLNPKKKRI